MTDNKRTIKQMVEAGLGPDVIADRIDLRESQSYADYHILECWLRRTMADPRQYRYVTGEQICNELESVASRIESEYDCGTVLVAEFYSNLSIMAFEEIADYCRFAADVLLKKGRR